MASGVAMRWCLLALLPLFAGATIHYEIEGVLSTIRPEDVRHHLSIRAGFLPSELKIRDRLSSLSEDIVEQFFIDFFEIHGEEHDRPTVIFHGYLSTELARIDIEKLVENTEDLHIFWLVPKPVLPSPSTLLSSSVAVDSCSNGGILLPNSTCACQPFFSGASCEIVQCLHEGIQNAGRCACPPGVATVNCEPRQCIPGTITDFNRDKSSFILVINQEVTGAAFLNSFFGELQHLDYASYNTFIVVNYVESAKGLYMQKKEFVYWTDMMDYLMGIVSVSSGKYQQPTNKAVLAAQSFAPYMMAFSRIIVITALPDSDNTLPTYALSSTNIATRLILKSITWRSRLLYIVPVTAPPLPARSFDVFHAVADATIGDVVYVDRNEAASEFVIPMVNNLYPAEVLSLQEGKGDAHLTIPATDLIVLVTVKPGETLPSISTSNQTDIASNSYNKILMVSDSNSIAALKGTNWVMKALVQTTSTASIAYSDDDSVDIGTAYAIANVPQFISAKLIGITDDASLAIVDQTTAAQKEAIRLAGCSYSSSFGKYNSFSITGPFVNYLKVAGNDYSLYIPGIVVSLDEKTPPPFQCFNGGTRITPSSCQCVSGFLSKDCSVPLCLNGGSPNPFPGNGRDLCSCPQGHNGDHCEKLDCYSVDSNQVWSQDKSLALVIQSSMSQASVNDDIGEGLVALLVENNVAFSQLVLTTFNNVAKAGQNRTIITTSNFNSTKEFINATSHVQYLASYTPTQDSLTALQNTVDSLLFDNSQIALFVDSKPTSAAAMNDLTQSALLKRTQIHVIVTSSFGVGQTCLDDATRQLYQKLAFNTGGYFLNFCDGADEIQEFFNLIALPFQNSQLALEDVSQSCSKPISFSLTFENGSDTYFVINGDNVNFANFTVSVALDGTDVVTGITSLSEISSLGVFKLNSDQLDSTKEYNIHVMSDPGVGQSLCSSKIIVQSMAEAFFGFTNRGSSVASKHLSFDDPSLVTFFLNDDSIERASLLVTSAKKSYSFTTQYANTESCPSQVLFDDSLICMSPNDAYLLKTLAVTQQGEYITRTQRSFCYKKSKSCLNGGTWQNNRCYCPTSYSGDYCEIPACKNGFSLDSNSQCFCSASFTGDQCQSEKCDSMNYMEAADVREFDFEQVIFVVNTNIDMLLVNVYLKNMIHKFTSDAQNPANPREFTLVTFDETNVNTVISTWNEAQFSEVFSSTLRGFSKVSGQPTRSLDALHQALRLVVKPTATVFLITGSSSLDPSIGTTILPKQQLGAQINVIFSPPGIVPISPTDERLTTAARLSGGRVIPLSQNSLPVMEVVMASSLKENALVMDDAVEDCSTEVDRAFFADSAATRVIFDLSGYGVSQNFVLRDTKGQVAKLSRNFTDTGVLIAELVLPEDGSGWGQWSFGVKTVSGSCFLQVRVESKLRLIPGFTVDAHNDFPLSQPFGERANPPLTRMAFRLSGLQGAFVDNLKVEDTNPAQPWNTTSNSASSPVHPRDVVSCAYQYMSESLALNPDSEYQKFTIWGGDSAGRSFKRIFFYETPSQDTDCKKGAVDDNGRCTCDANHFGDECSERRCVNGGSNSFGVCACPSGFYGMYCEKFFLFNGTSTTTAYQETTANELQTTTVLSTVVPTLPDVIPSSTMETMPEVTTIGNVGTTRLSTSQASTESTGATTVVPLSTLGTQGVTDAVVSQTSGAPTPALGTTQNTLITTSSASSTTTSVAPASVSSTLGSLPTEIPVTQPTAVSSTLPSSIGPATVPVCTSTLLNSKSFETTTFVVPLSSATPGAKGTTEQSHSTLVPSTGSSPSVTSSSSISTGTTQLQSSTTNYVSKQTSEASTVFKTTATQTYTSTTETSDAASSSTTVPATTTTTTTAMTTPSATTVDSKVSTMEPTDGPCAPSLTTYFYSFFIDTSDLFGDPPGSLYDVQKEVLSRVGEIIELGGGDSSSRFAISGVAADFYPGGIATNSDEINELFNGGDLFSPGGKYQVDYNKGIDGYLSSNYSEAFSTEQPPIAVLFAKQEIMGSQQDFVDHVKKLKAANYAVIGIDLSAGFQEQLSTYFIAALGSENVFPNVSQFQTSEDVAQFIVKRGCHFKPT